MPVTDGDESAPGVLLLIDGAQIALFSPEEAQAMGEHFIRAAQSAAELIAAGPPYPVSNARN